MRLLLLYLKNKRKDILLFCLLITVFAVVFMLYNLPLESIVYAVLLCTCLWTIITGFDFWQYYNKHSLLSELEASITLSIDSLPVTENLLELDYQNLLKIVHRDKMKLVSKADSARTDMVDYYTLWAHQIKTPIAAMRLLLQSSDNEQNTDLSAELFKIEQYVEMVLQYLRLDSTSTDFMLKRYKLENIVRQAVRKYAKLFIHKKISLDFKEFECEVLTDEKWLLFVIEQILSNALKYTHEGKISIYMDPSNSKTLVIEDTGIGIQPEDLPRVFEKGFTGYNGRTDKKSTGIGLYLCKRILTKLSHSISIESEVGKGTLVKLKLDSVNIMVE
jgi:signal transduction histidine kinase